jgi:diacylglycerol kinase (ATP)
MRDSDVPTPGLLGHRIYIAFNPVAGSGDRHARVLHLVEQLRGAGYDTHVCHDIDSLVDACERYRDSGELRGVVAAGGDGTFSLVANRVPPGTPISTFPLGTENLVARYLQQCCDPAELVQLFATGTTAYLDAGMVNGRLFTLMAGCGFDATVVERLHRERRGNIRHWSYIKPILDTVRTYRYPRLRVELVDSHGQSHDVECGWAFVVNVPRYACGIQLVPTAVPNDGLLDVVTFKRGSLLSGLGYLMSVLWGSHLRHADITCHRTAQVRITADFPVPFQVDGDPGGELPSEFHVAPARLRVIVSPEWMAQKTALTPAAVTP